METAAPHRSWNDDDGPLAALYLSHGAPMTFEDTAWMTELHDWARALPRPRAVLIVSAHWESTRGAVPGWSADFDAWAAEALATGDVDELSAFRDRAPGMPYAHPTVEHFTPLFVTLGAATDPTGPVTTAIEGFSIGLAKRSFQTA